MLQGCGKECAGLFSNFVTYCRQVSSLGEWKILAGKVSDRLPKVNNEWRICYHRENCFYILSDNVDWLLE